MLNIFRRLTLEQIIARELMDAKLHRLQAQTAQEYAACAVSYRDRQIERLERLTKVQQLALT